MSTVELWWDEVISKWKMIFIIVNNYYYYLRVSCLLWWGYDVSTAVLQRLLLARHFCLWAWNMLYHFAQNIPIPKNGHKPLKLYTEDNNEENKGAQTSFWSSLNWENRTSKKWDMLHYIQTYCLLSKGALQQQSHLRIINLFTSQPNFLETFCTLWTCNQCESQIRA